MAGIISVDPWKPVEKAYNYVDNRIHGPGPRWDALQNTLNTVDNQVKYNQNYHEAHNSAFTGRDNYNAGFKNGYVKGVADTVRREEPQKRPDSLFTSWRYNQNAAERRDKWTQNALREVEEHRNYLRDLVAAEALKTQREIAQKNYEPKSPPPYQPAYQAPYQQPPKSESPAQKQNFNYESCQEEFY